MAFYTDQLGRTIFLSSPPKRIVSLVPSQTELLHDLGLADEVVGVTKFCVHPAAWATQKEKIGGTKNLHIEKIASLRPDLILANKEENGKDAVEGLAKDFAVWTSDVNTLEDACDMIAAVGDLTGKRENAAAMVTEINQRFAGLPIDGPPKKAAYMIWKDPLMTVGGDTFIHDLLKKAGFRNVFDNKRRYPEVAPEDLVAAGCSFVLLSSEPYPFRQKHADDLQRHLPGTKIILVDGEMFSWYGSRLLQAPAYFSTLRKQIEAMP